MKRKIQIGFSQGHKIQTTSGHASLIMLKETLADGAQKDHIFFMFPNGKRFVSKREIETGKCANHATWTGALNNWKKPTLDLSPEENALAVALAKEISKNALFGYPEKQTTVVHKPQPAPVKPMTATRPVVAKKEEKKVEAKKPAPQTIHGQKKVVQIGVQETIASGTELNANYIFNMLHGKLGKVRIESSR